MAIDKFIYSLFIISISLIFIGIKTKTKTTEQKEQAELILEDSISYTLDSENMKRIIKSKLFSKYETREVLEDVTIVTRLDKINLNNVLTADLVIKKNNNIQLTNNVKYVQNNSIVLFTDKLNYDLKTKIAYNDVAFNGTYENNKITGTNLYFDIINEVFKSKYTQLNFNTKVKYETK